MLTFELSEDDDELHIHGDAKSLTQFANEIMRLTKNNHEHQHFMTKSWGGNELTEEPQGDNCKLLNMVTVHCWKE